MRLLVSAFGLMLLTGCRADDRAATPATKGSPSEPVQRPARPDAQIRVSGIDPEDSFGTEVALSGDFLLVGAPGEDGPLDNRSDAGAVYVFNREPDGAWAQTQVLRVPGSDGLGSEISADSTRAALMDFAGENAVHVFARQPGGTWVRESTIHPPSDLAGDGFNGSLSLKGSYLVAEGFFGTDDPWSERFSQGTAYVYKRDPDGDWAPLCRLKSSETDARDRFGESVSTDGQRIIVGAPGKKYSASDVYRSGKDVGAAYVFELPCGSQTGGDVIAETAILRASDGKPNDNFGRAVAIDGNVALVGAPFDADGSAPTDRAADNTGSVHVFRREAGWLWAGWLWADWTGVTQLQAPELGPGDEFGTSVALDGRWAVVGAPYDDGPEDQHETAGAAYLYRRAGMKDWRLVRKLRPTDLRRDARFGFEVALDEPHAAVGIFPVDIDVPGSDDSTSRPSDRNAHPRSAFLFSTGDS